MIITLQLTSYYLFQATEELLKKHYADLSSKPFFPGLVKYMSSGPVVPMVSNILFYVNISNCSLLYFYSVTKIYFNTFSAKDADRCPCCIRSAFRVKLTDVKIPGDCSF